MGWDGGLARTRRGEGGESGVGVGVGVIVRVGGGGQCYSMVDGCRRGWQGGGAEGLRG